MVSYINALKKAIEIRQELDKCIEYEKGYVFCTDKGEDQDGDHYSLIVVLKGDGKVIDMPRFVVNGTGKELKSY